MPWCSRCGCGGAGALGMFVWAFICRFVSSPACKPAPVQPSAGRNRPKPDRVRARKEVEQSHVEEVVLALFHTILMHRANGKFRYQKDDSYHIEETKIQDVKCKSLDITYVRCASPELDRSLRTQVARFSDKIALAGVPTTGQVALEFYEKKKKSWPFASGSVPWEVWNVRLTVTKASDNPSYSRTRVSEDIKSIIWRILFNLNRHDYVPPNPTHLELDTVYETGYSDVQPYLFKVNYNPSVTSTMTKLLRDIAIP